MAPSGATLAHYNSLGYRVEPRNWGPGSGMPPHGILTVTVPGSVWGWEDAPHALRQAHLQGGSAAGRRLCGKWIPGFATHRAGMGPARCAAARGLLHRARSGFGGDLVHRRPAAGRRPDLPQSDLAKTLRLLQQQGRDVFYKGEIARAIVAKSTALGGTMTLEDLAAYKGQWVEPAESSYHGYSLNELPPPSQAWGANLMLNLLEACVPKWAKGETLAQLGPRNPKYWHLLVRGQEARLCGPVPLQRRPRFVKVPLDMLLSKAHAAAQCAKLDPDRASPTGPASTADAGGDTIVLSTADDEGQHGVLGQQQLFGLRLRHHGAGLMASSCTIAARCFSLDPKSPNLIEPHKRPFNTLSAGIRDEGQKPADVDPAHGRRHAGAGPCPSAGERLRPRPPTCRRRPTWRASITPRWRTGSISS